MSLYRKLSSKPRLFLSVAGISLWDFQRLLPDFEHAFQQLESERKRRTVQAQAERQRAIGGGSQFAHDLPDQLLMLLLYYRLYLTQDFMTLLFRVESKSAICRNIQLMCAVCQMVLPVPAKAFRRILELAKKEQTRRNKRIGSIEEFQKAYPELTFLIDGVEQPKRKPQDKQKRKDDYSGKKNRHTRKQIVVSTPAGIIVDQSPSVGGRAHDFQVFKADHQARGVLTQLQEYRATLYADSGFQGSADLDLPTAPRLIKRGRRNHPLTYEERKLNRLRASIRIRVEHTFSRRKKYRIANEEYRNRDADYDQTMEIVGGLVNLRASDRIFQRTGLRL